jgi:hypothetical protein
VSRCVGIGSSRPSRADCLDRWRRGLRLHVCGQRFRRRDSGHLEIQITVDDPKMDTGPWTVTVTHDLLPDSELLEFVCLENEKSLQHMK